ncbi:MAG TPA: biotin-independent malonate decarboxylase subunit beta [Rubrobacter sp.]
MTRTDSWRPTLARRSFIELPARERSRAILDEGTFRELLGPFDRLMSPWLPRQGIVPQSDDGVVVARGEIDGRAAVVLAVESAFQGGSIGEVGGSKMAGALELALRDYDDGRPVRPVILFETGGVRLQEANLGLAVIAELNAAVSALRPVVPVVGVSAGMVGCFGGMGMTAGLCSYLILTRQARLGLNGPQVIEQEAGVEEFDSEDRALIYAVDGGEQRFEMGVADALVDDDASLVRDTVRAAFSLGVPEVHRSQEFGRYGELVERAASSPPTDPASLRTSWGRSEVSQRLADAVQEIEETPA